RRIAVRVPAMLAEHLMLNEHKLAVLSEVRLRSAIAPSPGVAAEQLRQYMDRCSLGTAIVYRDAHQHVIGVRLRVFDEHVEVAILCERAGVEQLVLGLAARPLLTLLHQLRVWIGALRVLVEHLQIGMSRRRVEVVIELLHVLAVIAFAVGQSEQPLLQNRIAAVPQRQRQTQSLLVIAESSEAVFTPAINAAARMIVRKVRPHVAVRTVVLAHGSPLALAQIRAPLFPSEIVRRALREPLALRRVQLGNWWARRGALGNGGSE